MSDEELKQLPSIWGYINWRELRDIIIASNVLQAVIESLIIPILQNQQMWLAEPWSSRLAPIFALAIALLSGRALGKRMIRQGD